MNENLDFKRQIFVDPNETSLIGANLVHTDWIQPKRILPKSPATTVATHSIELALIFPLVSATYALT